MSFKIISVSVLLAVALILFSTNYVSFNIAALSYGAAQYRVTDFTKIGLPANIIFGILATIFI